MTALLLFCTYPSRYNTSSVYRSMSFCNVLQLDTLNEVNALESKLPCNANSPLTINACIVSASNNHSTVILGFTLDVTLILLIEDKDLLPNNVSNTS